MINRLRAIILWLLGLLLWNPASVARPQEEIPFIPTPMAVVDRMLELAEVKKEDVVFDMHYHSIYLYRIEEQRSSARLQLTQEIQFDSWRPYKNPKRLVRVGMNKGQVMAIAGNPDREESYYRLVGSRLIRISDWYYVQEGMSPETTLLKFHEEALVSITITPVLGAPGF